jgi:hypothetical protein
MPFLLFGVLNSSHLQLDCTYRSLYAEGGGPSVSVP